jgi:hypothetical protein
MKSRIAGAGVFAANLAAFCICACLAFARNINALFFHYDGSYMLVDARDQLRFGQPLFEYADNYLQSIGNICDAISHRCWTSSSMTGSI